MEDFVITYGYLVGDLILGVVWLSFYFLRKDLRKELVWISSIMLIAGVTEKFFVPVYWSPGSLFDLIDVVGFGIESFLFAFFAAGIAGVSYEIFARKHLRKGHWQHSHGRLLPVVVFFTLLFFMVLNEMNIHLYSLIIPALVAALMIGFYRRDLVREIVVGGLYFALLYLVLFVGFSAIFPGYIHGVYNLENLWGLYIFGIPLEEVVFAFAIGAMLSPMYEYVQGYRVYSLARK